MGVCTTPFISSENTSVYAQYTIQIENRDKVIKKMKTKGIPTSIHYPSLLSDQEALNTKTKNIIKNIFTKNLYKSKELNNAKSITKKVMSLPMHPYLSDDDQDLVVNNLIESIN